MKPFSRKYRVIWANLDPNQHMRHTAYNDFAAQLRVECFKEFDLELRQMVAAGVGPILFREDTRFYREVRMNEEIEVNCAIAKLREDGSKWSMFHEIHKESGELACTIAIDGAWLNLERRRIAIPPKEIADSMLRMPRKEDFEWIPIKKG